MSLLLLLTACCREPVGLGPRTLDAPALPEATLALVQTAPPRSAPGSTDDNEGSEMARMKERLEAVAERVKQARRIVSLEGEDARSAFATIRWIDAAGTTVKIRWVWNGGCCSDPEVHDFLFAGDDLIGEHFFVGSRDDEHSLMAGDEPRHPILLDERLFEHHRLILWAGTERRNLADGSPELEGWRAQEAQTLELLSQLRQSR